MILELYKAYRDNENGDIYLLIKFNADNTVYFFAKSKSSNTGWAPYMLQLVHLRKDHFEDYELSDDDKYILINEVFFYYPREWR